MKASGADCLCARDESAGGAERGIEGEYKCFLENISTHCEFGKGSGSGTSILNGHDTRKGICNVSVII